MTTPHDYEVNLHWIKDRIGTLSSPAFSAEIEVATPPEFPQGVAGFWSPEHLLAASVNSCFMTTFLAVADNSKVSFQSFNSKAVAKLDTVENKLRITEIALYPTVMIDNEVDKEKFERMLLKSERACLISNSIQVKVVMKPEIKINTLQ